jgi:SAM-dependent methyltransferase
MPDRVAAYYDRFDEWSRLESPEGRLEYERTLAYISEALGPKSVVLDLGGGPGRYAVALAAQGHTVCLLDLSAKQVEEARSRAAQAGVLDRMPLISVGCATDLSALESASFGAVLALGPFYHLIEPSARESAALEIRRVLQPGGLAFVSFIPRASGVAGLIIRAAQDPEQVTPAVLERVIAEGVFVNPTQRGFQNGYYPHVTEIEELFSRMGFDTNDLFSIRGLYFGAEVAAATIQEQSPHRQCGVTSR